MSPWPERWRAARNVLCVRLDNLGDVLMTTPAIRALAHTLPEARITLLASDSGAAVAHYVPEIDDVIRYAAPWAKPARPTSLADDFSLLEKLAARRFDAAIVFTVYTQSALPAAMLCRLAGIPLRLAQVRENPYELLTDWLPEADGPGAVRHEVQRQLDLVAHVGMQAASTRMRFAYDRAEWASAREILAQAGVDPEREWIVIHPGASAASRRYPSAGFGAAAARIAGETGLQVVFTGGASEHALVAATRDAMAAAGAAEQAYDLCGRLGLGQLGAVIDHAALLIGNNSGPAHLAAALGTPVVDLYALTNPQHTPWRVPSRVLFHDVPCKYCLKSTCPQGHNACLTRVTPEQVAQAALELLSARRARTRAPRARAPAARSPQPLALASLRT